MAIGILLNHFIVGLVEQFYVLADIGLFLVIYAIMFFVEVKGIGQAFTKVKPTALAFAMNFLLTLFYAWFLSWLFLRT